MNCSTVPVELLCPEARLRIPFTPQPRRALAPEIEPPRLAGQVVHGSSSEHRSGTAPHHLAPLVVGVRCDQLVEPVGVLARRREPLQCESDPRLAHPEAPLVIRRRENRARSAARDKERNRRAVRPALDAATSRAPERPPLRPGRPCETGAPRHRLAGGSASRRRMLARRPRRSPGSRPRRDPAPICRRSAAREHQARRASCETKRADA